MLFTNAVCVISSHARVGCLRDVAFPCLVSYVQLQCLAVLTQRDVMSVVIVRFVGNS